MILKDETTGKIISKDLKICRGFWDLFLGLHIKSNPRSLLFNTRFGVHTFFLKNKIDVIVLDSKYRAVKIKHNLQPNRMFFWDMKYDKVIELPANTIAHNKIKKRHKLSIS